VISCFIMILIIGFLITTIFYGAQLAGGD